jgi:hypothetical protein
LTDFDFFRTGDVLIGFKQHIFFISRAKGTCVLTFLCAVSCAQFNFLCPGFLYARQIPVYLLVFNPVFTLVLPAKEIQTGSDDEQDEEDDLFETG